MALFRLAAGLVSLLVLSAIVWIKWPQFPGFPAAETWSMLLGYLGYILIAMTLLLGPLKYAMPPRWGKYLLQLRRDLGIGAGFAAIGHVALVLYIFERGAKLFFLQTAQPAEGWLGLFFLGDSAYSGPLSPHFSLTGISNYMGLLAFVILLALWITSSRYAEKLLGGASWKRLHLSNPLLFVLVMFHALIYINSIKGEPHSPGDFLWLAGIVAVLRLAAFGWNVFRRRS
ncbi:ferric reductase-like transmembrane domain-containing protein [Brevibacillus composti]|uniref:Ferric reductase-like transmembrane domain-containing protein n=1 Tax=Brevibacillus composti TaxID=2796470 RepID=A0A7T5EJK5_9BACL|nr:ferric reductase-like transmembrane domain-containing protein [Brevibacillus composti]QQE73763.1 ferric reductase-like transmembrane domain-containing protein [Brevibacillus composti]QUO40846.1 ferric reductase-like transmembrane domain-containing protein [Brevibacillus composti]